MVSIWGSFRCMPHRKTRYSYQGVVAPNLEIPLRGAGDVGLGTPARTQVTSHRMEVLGARPCGRERENVSFGATDEGKTFYQEDVREMSDHQTPWSRMGDLPQSTSQAASRVI